MKKYLTFLLLMLIGCKIDSDKKVDRSKFTFKTGDDTELFFKNVRQSYYDLEENKAAKFNVFRFEDRDMATNKPVVNLAIVMNYLNDEAYLLVEPNAYLDDQDVLEVHWKTTGDSASTGIIKMENFDNQSMLEFASEVYEVLIKHASFEIKVDNQFQPFLESSAAREAFRITVSDYYRLTRIY